MLVVHAVFVVQPDKRDDLVRLVRKLFEPTRAEQGCLDYHFYNDIEDPDRFVFVEEWQDREALNRHLRKPYVLGLIAALPKLLQRPAEVRIHDVASTETR